VTDPIERSARERLAAEGIPVTSWGNGPGDRYAPHEHAFDKVLVVVEGSITFRLTAPGGDHELLVGDRLDLPSGTTHAAGVGPAGVRCLEGHLPAGSLSRQPRRMADWAAGPRQPVLQTGRDGET
jgi:quercetin dioxygenase-like cupin family protein